MEEIQKNGGFLENAEFSGETSFSPSFMFYRPFLPTNICPPIFSHPIFLPTFQAFTNIFPTVQPSPCTNFQVFCPPSPSPYLTSGNMYGTTTAAVHDVLNAGKILFLGKEFDFSLKGKICILDIDVQGVKAVKPPQISFPIIKYHQLYQSKILISIILSLKTS